MEMKKAINDLLKLDLQYFAEGDDPDNPPGDSGDEEKDKEPEKVELTADELQKKIEAESDRKLNKALEKKQKEWEKQLDDKIKAAKSEAEDYAKMTQKQKDDAEYDKRMKALEEREKELNNKQLLSEIQSDLKDNELPVEFAESLLTIQDNEKIKEKIAALKKSFDDAVNEKVKEALRQPTPKSSNGKATAITKEQFNKMSYTEREQLFNDKPDLYNELTKK